MLYPEATESRCSAALLVDVDPVGLVRNRRGPSGNDFSLSQYVNDRPFVASSFMSVALAKVFSTAMSGRSKERPELAELEIPAGGQPSRGPLPRRGGSPPATLRAARLRGDGHRHPAGRDFPAWGDSRYLAVRLSGTKKVKDLLEHLFVLLPVLDDDKHYWVGPDEVEKLLRRGGDWLAAHPERELIANRYLRHDRHLTREAMGRLMEDDPSTPTRRRKSTTPKRRRSSGRSA